ncbi:MAG: NAD(P)/FAD-dependent oxidoreductase [Anaerolineae bacterium]|nr:NAD(P)/FAD-dependent oxidoreductase [Anaerolineae bacterium]
MKHQHNHTDVIIVGGGLAGLTAAAFLARSGRRVMLYEKAHDIGGRAHTQQKNGFYFNLGPHALYRLGEGVKVLNELGVAFDGHFPNLNGGVLVKDGRPYPLPFTPGALLTTKAVRWSAKWQLIRFLAGLSKIDSVPLETQTIQAWFEAQGYNADTRTYLQALMRLSTYTDDIKYQSAGAAIAQVQLAAAGNVLYIDNGWQVLVDELRCLAASAGAIIESGARVAALDWHRQQGVNGVRLADGSSQTAAAVIIAASPAAAQSLIGQQSIVDSWAKAAVPVKAAILDVALERLPRPETTFALGMDQPLYLSVHSAAAHLAPPGGALIHTAKYLNASDPDPELAQRELTALLDLTQPGWRDHVVEQRFLPDMTVTHAVITAEHGGLSGRPGPTVPGIPGLYLAGDWIGPTGMLSDASFASAHQSAQLVQDYLADQTHGGHELSESKVKQVDVELTIGL